MRNAWLNSGYGKQTIRSELQRIPEYGRSPRTKRHESFYMINTKKNRLEEERNTEIEKNNRMLYEKIRKIMMKGRSKSENKNKESLPQLNTENKMMLTFMKSSEIPELEPLPTPIASKTPAKATLRQILEHRTKFIDRYFQSIKETRQMMKNKTVEQLGTVVVGKWTVTGVLIDDCVILRGKCADRELSKKYPYSRVAKKINEDFNQWVTDKFSFEV